MISGNFNAPFISGSGSATGKEAMIIAIAIAASIFIATIMIANYIIEQQKLRAIPA